MKEMERTARETWANKDRQLSVNTRMQQAADHATHMVRRYFLLYPQLLTLCPRLRRFLDAVT
jgi:hypothetical protein